MNRNHAWVGTLAVRQEVIVIAALCIVVGIGCTEAPEEEPAPSADVEESTPRAVSTPLRQPDSAFTVATPRR